MSRPMRLWRESYAIKPSYGGSAGLSIVAHTSLILMAVVATRHAPEQLREQIAEMMVKFHVPEDRSAGQAPREERIQWLTLGAGPAVAPLVDLPSGQSAAGRQSETPTGIDVGNTEFNLAGLPALPGMDSVYSKIEVDSTVQRDPFSAAPAYPPELLAAGVQGSTVVRYVVDTTGRADMRTFQALRTSHSGFTKSVQEALPLMRFTPAKIGPGRVRQLVEQEFFFKIDSALIHSARRDTRSP